MKIIAFTGMSGSGKSTKAVEVAKNNNADYIIDDGMLIRVKDRKIIAGILSKALNGNLDIIRAAAFHDTEHAKSIKKALDRCKPKVLLMVGPHIGNISCIVDRIGITGEIENEIKIEDVSKKEDIEIARETRYNDKTHSLPVSKKEYLRVLRNLKKKGVSSEKYTFDENDILSIGEYVVIKNEAITKSVFNF